MIKRIKMLLPAVLAVLLLAGCNVQSAAATTARYRVTVVAKSRESEFWKAVLSGAEAAATEYNMQLTVLAPDNEENYDAQNQLIEKAVEDGAQAIVFSAIDYEANAEAIDAAAAAGVTIVGIDSAVHSDQVAAYIGSDNYGAGRLAARSALEGTEGKLCVGLINYEVNGANGRDREQGARDTFADSGRAEVVTSMQTHPNAASAHSDALRMLQQHPEINVLVAFNEATAVGAVQAVQEMERVDDLWLVAFDSNVQTIDALQSGAVDALIVQDMALRRMNLPVELHASTQAATRTPEQALFLERCGFARVILERALSLDEIRTIRAACGVDLECFVHGAICVGYSGRCFLSRSMSERSGNRGACSQPCRLTYDLVDESGRTVVKGRHLLSVRDLNLSDRIGELIDAGITSFKIEGRLKDIGYIKNVVSYYRQRIDRALASRPGFCRSSVGESRPDFQPDPSKSFTRGESEYFFDGRRAGVASFDTPKAVGEPLGRIVRVDRGSFTLSGPCDLAPGDGICLLTRNGLAGTNVNEVAGSRIVPNRMEGVVAGAEVFRNFDRRFSLALDRSRTRRVIPVRADAAITPLRVTVRFTDCEGVAAEVTRDGVFEPAKDSRKMSETVAAQLSRSGDTIFDVREVRSEGCDRFVPVSLLAELRREGLERLRRARLDRPVVHAILPEDRSAPYPSKVLTAEENVTNRLAEEFYRDHGVRQIARGLDLEPATAGHPVMRSAYCIRREIGQCLKEHPTLKGELFLMRGRFRYRLRFDCARCEMSLIDESDRK